MNKKGVELSINFLVMFILAIVVFGMSIYIVKMMTSNSKKIIDDSTGKLESQIADLTCPVSQKVCVANNHISINRGEVQYIGFFISNYLNTDKDFSVAFSRASAPDGAVPVNGKLWEDISVVQSASTFTLKAKEQKKIVLAVSAGKTAVSGDYAVYATVDPIDDTTGASKIITKISFKVN